MGGVLVNPYIVAARRRNRRASGLPRGSYHFPGKVNSSVMTKWISAGTIAASANASHQAPKPGRK